MFKKMLCLIMVLGLAGVASATVDTTWTGGLAGNEWTIAGNWDNGVPGPNYTAYVGGAGDVANITSGTQDVGVLRIGGASGTSRVNMSGGTLQLRYHDNPVVAGTLRIGDGNGLGELYMSGGNITVDTGAGEAYSYVNVGTLGVGATGYINMTGGTIKNYWHLQLGQSSGDSTGKIDILGGVYDASAGPVYIHPGSQINIGGSGYGELWLPWNKMSDLLSWISAGKITAYNGNTQVVATQAGTWDPIIVTPEPMTIALLGLGGLFLRRRKR
jgi:hypothetical protein